MATGHPGGQHDEAWEQIARPAITALSDDARKLARTATDDDDDDDDDDQL